MYLHDKYAAVTIDKAQYCFVCTFHHSISLIENKVLIIQLETQYIYPYDTYQKGNPEFL